MKTNLSDTRRKSAKEKLNNNLYQISLTALVFILAFIITKVSYCLSLVTTEADVKLLSTITVSTILIVLVDIAYTMVYAHSQKEISFQPIYFVFSVLLILFPLYLSSDLISSNLGKAGGSDIESLKQGILALLICFISLVIYLRMVMWHKEKSGMKNSQFITVSVFHLLGIGYCLYFLIWINLNGLKHIFYALIIPACVVFAASILYLIVAFSYNFQLEVKHR